MSRESEKERESGRAARLDFTETDICDKLCVCVKERAVRLEKEDASPLLRHLLTLQSKCPEQWRLIRLVNWPRPASLTVTHLCCGPSRQTFIPSVETDRQGSHIPRPLCLSSVRDQTSIHCNADLGVVQSVCGGDTMEPSTSSLLPDGTISWDLSDGCISSVSLQLSSGKVPWQQFNQVCVYIYIFLLRIHTV